MVPIMAKMASESGDEWCKLLSKAEFVMNNMVSGATRDTPARLLFGVDQRFGQKSDVDDWMDGINQEEEVTMQERRAQAKMEIDRVQNYNKEYYDRKVVKEKEFNEGDLVLLKGRKVIGKKSKLYGKFKGPYRVVKVLEKNRYVVSDVEGMQVGKLPYTGIVDTERMKLYEGNRIREDSGGTEDDTAEEVLGLEEEMN